MNYEQSQKEIMKLFKSMTGKYKLYEIFQDFLIMMACMISNKVDVVNFEEREEMYAEKAKKYTDEEKNTFANIIALMTVGMSNGRMGDYIGELYMQMEFGNEHTGQFFTPYDVSRLTAKMIGHKPNIDGIYNLNESSVGSGGMVVAFAEELHLQEINYQKKLRVICNDIDYDVVKMCYIQLSLYGIDAIVMQGDTILNKMNEVWYTPMHLINIAREKEENKTKNMIEAMTRIMRRTEAESITNEQQLNTLPGQMDIFDFIAE